MSAIDDRAVYAARAERALSLAKTAKDPIIADTNRRLAASYTELAEISPKRLMLSPGRQS